MSLLALPTLGADGATPVWEPTTIDTPGRYILTRNITSAVNPVITISSDDVHLDLGGFKIEGDADVFAADVILVTTGCGITIRNGTVIGGGAGVRLSSSTSQFRLEELVIRGGRTGVGTAATSSLGIVQNNIIEDCSDEGISGSGSSIQIRNNVVSADGKGIKIDNCDACMVSQNTVRDASDAGIAVETSNGNLVLNNTVTNSGAGIRIGQGGHHQIEGNVISGNTGFGVFFKDTSFASVYRSNTSRNNSGSGCAGSGSTSDFCDEGSGNTSHGDNYMPDMR